MRCVQTHGERERICTPPPREVPGYLFGRRITERRRPGQGILRSEQSNKCETPAMLIQMPQHLIHGRRTAGIKLAPCIDAWDLRPSERG